MLEVVPLVLLPLATWRLYHLIATDTGPKCILRRFRIWVGVRYTSPDYSTWETDDGSFAEGLCCSKCATIWWGTLLVALMLFVPHVYLPLALVLNVSALALAYENCFYAPREK